MSVPLLVEEESRHRASHNLAIDLKETLVCAKKSSILHSETVGDVFTPVANVVTVGFRRADWGADIPLTVQPQYQPLLGGDAAGSKTTATKALVEGMGVSLLGGTRTLAALIQTAYSGGLNLDRILFRAAALVWSIRARCSQRGAGQVRVMRVEPPERRVISHAEDLARFYRDVTTGRIGFMPNVDRPPLEAGSLFCVMECLLSARLDWSAGGSNVSYLSDSLWPELTRHPAGTMMGLIDVRSIPRNVQAIAVADVYTAMETLLADFGQDTGVFDRWVKEVGVLSLSPNGLFFGVFKNISLALPGVNMMPLSLLPILSKPGSETLVNCKTSKGNMLPAAANACHVACVIGAAWGHVIELMCELPARVDPAVRQVFMQRLMVAHSCRAMWSVVCGMITLMGHEGNVGGVVCSLVPSSVPTLGMSLTAAPRSVRKIPIATRLNALMHPPVLDLRQVGDAAAEMSMLSAHVAQAQNVVMNYALTAVVESRDGVLYNITPLHCSSGMVADQVGNRRTVLTGIALDHTTNYMLGANLNLRSTDVKWFLDKTRLPDRVAGGFVGQLFSPGAPPAPPSSAPPPGPGGGNTLPPPPPPPFGVPSAAAPSGGPGSAQTAAPDDGAAEDTPLPAGVEALGMQLERVHLGKWVTDAGGPDVQWIGNPPIRVTRGLGNYYAEIAGHAIATDPEAHLADDGVGEDDAPDAPIDVDDGTDSIPDIAAPVSASVADHIVGRGSAADAAARGIVAACPNISWVMARSFVGELGSKMAMTLAKSLCAVGSQIELDGEIMDACLAMRVTPVGLLPQARRGLRDYWAGGGSQPADQWSPEEKDRIKDWCTMITTLRTNPATQVEFSDLTKRGPYAGVRDVIEAAREGATGAQQWKWCQGIKTVSGIDIHVGDSEPPPLDWTAQPGLSLNYHGVEITTEAPPATGAVYGLVKGKFGDQRVYSAWKMPTTTVTVRGTNSWVNNRGQIDDTVESLFATGVSHFVVESRGKLFHALVSRLSDDGVSATVHVMHPEKLKNEIHRLEVKLAAGAKADANAAADKGTEYNSERVSLVDALAAYLAARGADGGRATGADVAAAALCYHLARTAVTREEFIQLCDTGLGLATIVDTQLVRPTRATDELVVELATNKTSLAWDSPRYNEELSVAAAKAEVADGTWVPDRSNALGVWRSSFMSRAGRLDLQRYANKLRALKEDEVTAVELAQRMCAKSGVLTPVEAAVGYLHRAWRGCGDGHCWCNDSVHSVVDQSRSTGGAEPNLGTWASCTSRWPTTGEKWMMHALWKGYEAPSTPWARLFRTPACVLVEDMQEIMDDMNLEVEPVPDYPEKMENIQLGGARVTCTPAMAKYALTGWAGNTWAPTCNAAPQMQCAYMLWASGLSPHVRTLLEERGVATASLKEVIAWDSSVKNLVRRSAMVGPYKGDEWLQLRKLGAVLARHNIVADYDGDEHKRACVPVMKTTTALDYSREFKFMSDEVARHQIPLVARRGDSRTADAEWEMRAVAATNGSSSLSSMIQKLGRGSPNAAPADRLTKKAALSSLPRGWWTSGLTREPVNLGRRSTKPEPANRARVLIASGDHTTAVATHGLRGFEGSANYGGMSASQRPEVIANWLVAVKQVGRGIQWSADLDDYNWQHEAWELEQLWSSRARAFEAHGGQECMSRAASCWRIANSMRLSVLTKGDGLIRSYLGLYSGHRGTTEDNTAKHEIDRLIVLRELGAWGLRIIHYNPDESGDDEWLWTSNWASGAAYLQMARLMGLRMNAAKQMGGREHAEYLQRGISRDAAPKQPLASLLATLCTGNWFRPSGVWLNSAMDGTTECWVEAAARGMPLCAAARMCAMVLDQVMREPGTGEALNWRKHACCSKAGQILFGGVEGFGDNVLPDLVVRQRPQRVWASHGVSDYMQTPEARWIRAIMPPKAWMLEQWLDSVKIDAHGSSEMCHERDRAAKLVADRWEKRDVFVEVPWGRPELPPAPGLTSTYTAIVRAKHAGRAVTMEDNLSAMGLGAKEAAMLGGYESLMSQAPPEKLVRVKPLVDPPCEVTRVAADANIRACLRVHAGEHKDFGMVYPSRGKVRTVVVVAAKHGAGMSRIARRFRQGHMVRYDRLASGLIGQEAYHRPTGNDSEDKLVHERGHRIVARHLASGGRPDVKVLLTHEYPNELVSALRAQGMQSYWYFYEPDEGERCAAVAARMVAPGLLRYMQSCWRKLSAAGGYADRVTTEHGVVQIVAVH